MFLARSVRPFPTDSDDVTDGAPRRSVFVPVFLMALALSVWFAFQTVQLVREHQQLDLLRTSLRPQEEASTKLRASLDQVATATAKLAAQGNANAQAIVEQLRSRGITINPSKATTPP